MEMAVGKNEENGGGKKRKDRDGKGEEMGTERRTGYCNYFFQS